jgi:hypothetical protein
MAVRTLPLAVLVLGITMVGCATPAPTPRASPQPVASSSLPVPSSPPVGSAAPPNASANANLDTPKIAAQHLLATKAYDLQLKIVREQGPTDPVETLVTGAGRMEPPTGRGHVRYDFTGLFAGSGTSPAPSASAGSSAAPSLSRIVDLVWTPDNEYLRTSSDANAKYQAQTRVRARQSGGVVGRLPDEVLGLATLIAGSDPSQARPLDPAELGGFVADRWTIAIPVDAAAAAGVPGYLPNADAIRQQYGTSEIDVEVWIIGGVLRRFKYELARAQGPGGGPDRTTTMYDWLNASDDVAIEVPG